MPRVNINTENMGKAKVRYDEGESLKSLAAFFQCSIPTMSRKLKDAGVVIRPKGRQKMNGSSSSGLVGQP